MSENGEYFVKFHTISFLKEVDDEFNPGEKRLVPVFAQHGQKVSTETEGDDPNTVYGLREAEIPRLKALGAFFDEGEVEAFEAGLTDTASTEQDARRLGAPRGDTATSPRFPAAGEDSALITGPHPLSFEEMTPEQMANWITENDIPPSKLIEIAEANPNLANKILNAENLATGAEPREGLAEGIAAALGQRVGPAPTGSEGVEGTLPEGAEESADDSGSSEETG